MARDWRDDRIEQLERENAALRKRVADLEAIVDKLQRVVEDLQEKVGRNSQNSSKPPSSDGPATPARPRKPPTGRKAGAQPGHPAHQRPLVPVDQVSWLQVVMPTGCDCCGGHLQINPDDAVRHQVIHIRPTPPDVWEYQMLAGWCAKCDHWTRAKLPDGVPTGWFGPSVLATVAVLMGVLRLSKRATVEAMWGLFRVKMSPGAVVGCQQLVSEALQAPVAEAHAFVQQEPIKNADETGWRQGRKRAWLWMAVSGMVAVFLVHTRRTKQAARELLGKATGVLGSDRYGAYNFWPRRLHQVCWSHLIRDFQAIAERTDGSKRIGEGLLEQSREMFKHWHRVRDGTLSRATFRRYMQPIQRRVLELLAEGRLLSGKTGRTCSNMLDDFACLWTFVRVEGVEPTNNDSERTVRHGVLYRRVCHGTHSESGSRFVERMLTVHATLKRQKRDAYDFVREACEAALARQPSPSLLPIQNPRVLADAA